MRGARLGETGRTMGRKLAGFAGDVVGLSSAGIARIPHTPRPLGTPLHRGDFGRRGLAPLYEEGWRAATGCVETCSPVTSATISNDRSRAAWSWIAAVTMSSSTRVRARNLSM